MHEPVLERLEEYLSGGDPVAEVEEHLKNCRGCREELQQMKAHAALFQALRPETERELDPGFYGRVMNRIESQVKPSIWSLFGESLFAKQLAYASMACLVLLGAALVTSSTEQEPLAVAAPERILAGEFADNSRVRMQDVNYDRDVVLATLATYRQEID